MNPDLSHLTGVQQKELPEIVEMILEAYDNHTHGPRPYYIAQPSEPPVRNIHYIFLIGCFENEKGATLIPGEAYHLLIVANRILPDFDRWCRDITRKLDAKMSVRTHLIMSRPRQINKKILRGDPFYDAIRKQYILLYISNPVQDQNFMLLPLPAAVRQRCELAQQNYHHGHGLMSGFMSGALNCRAKGDFRMAAFLLHQGAEQTYNMVIMTHLSHAPRVRDLTARRDKAEMLCPDLKQVWGPLEATAEIREHKRRTYHLLRRAHQEACWSEYYKIEEKQLDDMITAVEELALRATAACKAHMHMQKARQQIGKILT